MQQTDPGPYGGPRGGGLQGYLAHKKTPTPLGSPEVPRHKATVGSYGGGLSYERGTPVMTIHIPSSRWLMDFLYHSTLRMWRIGIGLLWGPSGGRFLMSEAPLYVGTIQTPTGFVPLNSGLPTEPPFITSTRASALKS